jgi:hypothetical protein
MTPPRPLIYQRDAERAVGFSANDRIDDRKYIYRDVNY